MPLQQLYYSIYSNILYERDGSKEEADPRKMQTL